MKRILLLFTLIGSIAVQAKPPAGWKLTWAEEFNRKAIDTTKWNIAPRGTADWNRYMAPALSDELVLLKQGKLLLIGKQLTDSTLVTGGLDSRGKFGFTYGRIDIRAKVQSATGAWPALWAVGAVGQWPDSGEIDIVEHLNHDDFVYQTFHSAWTYTLKQKTPPPGGKGSINKQEYNLYTLLRTPEKITWLINGVETFSYAKLDDPEALAKGQWPLDHPYYFILSQQLGGPGTWVGEINPTELPVSMWVDYIRVYEKK